MNIDIMYSKEEIQNKIKLLASKINDYYNKDSIVIICILKGSFIFCSDLVRNLNMPLKIAFIKASSYRDKTYSDGKVDIIDDIDDNIENKNILVVDDIIDTGYTLNKIISLLKEKNPKSIKLCTLFNKEERRKVDLKSDFYGFDLPNEFIIGYGLDYNEEYRNLPYIGKIKQIKK